MPHLAAQVIRFTRRSTGFGERTLVASCEPVGGREGHQPRLPGPGASRTHLGTPVHHTDITPEEDYEARKRGLDVYYSARTVARIGSAVQELAAAHVKGTRDGLTRSEASEWYRRRQLNISDGLNIRGVNDEQVV